MRQNPTKNRSHAEEVRERRAREAARPIQARAKSKSGSFDPLGWLGGGSKKRYAYTAKPVVIRSGAARYPAQRNVQSKVRKQVVIPLGTPGAELRLPGIASMRPGWRMASGLLAIALAFVLYTFYNNPTFLISEAKVTGAVRLTAEEINKALDMGGMPIIEAIPQNIENKLLNNFHELSQVQVSIALPAKLSIKVTERQPVLAWNQDGKTFWIDRDGIDFPARGDGSNLVQVKAAGSPPRPAPPVQTDATTTSTLEVNTKKDSNALEPLVKFIEPDLIQALVSLGMQTPKGTPVVYNPEYGLGWVDPEGWQVFFGNSTADMESKLATYRAIVDYVTQNKIKPKLISVQFPHAPFYRLEQ